MLKLLQHKITEILTLNLDPRWGQVPNILFTKFKLDHFLGGRSASTFSILVTKFVILESLLLNEKTNIITNNINKSQMETKANIQINIKEPKHVPKAWLAASLLILLVVGRSFSIIQASQLTDRR